MVARRRGVAARRGRKDLRKSVTVARILSLLGASAEVKKDIDEAKAKY